MATQRWKKEKKKSIYEKFQFLPLSFVFNAFFHFLYHVWFGGLCWVLTWQLGQVYLSEE